MGYQWEENEFDRNNLGTMGTQWEFNPLPLQKLRNIPCRNVGATQSVLLACFILRFVLETSYYDRCYSCMEFLKTNCPRAGRENQMEQLKRWADYVCMQILSACLPFRQRISRSRHAGPRVVTIMCVPHLQSGLTGDHRRLNAGKWVPCWTGIDLHRGFTVEGTGLNAGKWVPCWSVGQVLTFIEGSLRKVQG